MAEMHYQNYIGIDVSKKYLDVCVRSTGKVIRTDNHASGLKKLARQLADFRGALVVVEATGGYERGVVKALQLAGFFVAIVNPRKVKSLSRALGNSAKTDAIDARVLAHFAETIQPRPQEMFSPEEEELAALQQRRKQLVDALTVEKNRLESAHKNIWKHIRKAIRFLEKQLEEVEKASEELIDQNKIWSEKKALLTSIKGVGNVTAATLIAALPELGQVDNKAIAALVGVAPFNHDSGDFKGRRLIWGGRSDVRRALYMATLVAVRYNQKMRAFYTQLLVRGKKKKVTLVACMRKLLLIMNAMLRKGESWKEVRRPLEHSLETKPANMAQVLCEASG